MTNFNEKVEKLFNDEAFVKDLFSSETLVEMQEKLNANGLELSLDETKTFMEEIAKVVEGKNDELSEEDLDDVSGGFAVTTAILIAAAKIAGVGLASFLAAYLVTRSISKALHSLGC